MVLTPKARPRISVGKSSDVNSHCVVANQNNCQIRQMKAINLTVVWMLTVIGPKDIEYPVTTRSTPGSAK
jgi:hypothetical protein